LTGDLALDFLNTRMTVGGELRDFFQSGEDVLVWLKQARLLVADPGSYTASLSPLRSARTLRENIQFLVEKREAGQRGKLSVLNSFLVHAPSHPRLVWKKPHSLTIERIRQQDPPEAILTPIAEAAAVLLATADFNFIKRCVIRWFATRGSGYADIKRGKQILYDSGAVIARSRVSRIKRV
jgi:predicted RNA-binding Zn ribbon-like protein